GLRPFAGRCLQGRRPDGPPGHAALAAPAGRGDCPVRARRRAPPDRLRTDSRSAEVCGGSRRIFVVQSSGVRRATPAGRLTLHPPSPLFCSLLSAFLPSALRSLEPIGGWAMPDQIYRVLGPVVRRQRAMLMLRSMLVGLVAGSL